MFCKSAFLIAWSIATSAISIQSSCVGHFLACVACRGSLLQAEKVFSLLLSLHSLAYNCFINSCCYEAFENMQSAAMCSHHYSMLFSVLIHLERYFKYSSGRKIVTFSLWPKIYLQRFPCWRFSSLYTVIDLHSNRIQFTENSILLVKYNAFY